MKEIIDRIVKETGISREMAEKAAQIVLDEVEQELPLSVKTEIDLELVDLDNNRLVTDRQPFIIP